MPDPSKIPAFGYSRQPLLNRARYDFSDYGFVLQGSLADQFEIIPITVDDNEAMLFLYPKRDLGSARFSLFNLHGFLKRTGDVESFAHSLGPSVSHIALDDTTILGQPAKIYHRVIAMKDLFEGAPQVIDLIGGSPELVVHDSHAYFLHRHNHYYSGMLHEPGEEDAYDALRQTLFAGVTLV